MHGGAHTPFGGSGRSAAADAVVVAVQEPASAVLPAAQSGAQPQAAQSEGALAPGAPRKVPAGHKTGAVAGTPGQ